MTTWKNPDEVREYVLLSDLPKPTDDSGPEPEEPAPPSNPVVWRYRLLSAAEHWRLQSIPFERSIPRVSANGDGEATQSFRSTVDVGAAERKILLACCVSVEGLRDERGGAVAYPADGTEAAKLRFWSGVSAAARTELANAFSLAQSVTDRDRRDFSSQSSSDGTGTSSTAANAPSGDSAPATAPARA